MPTSNAKLIAAAAHLSYLIGLPVVVPLLIYIYQRDEPFVADHAKQALGWHLAACAGAIALFACFVVAGSFGTAQLLMLIYVAGFVAIAALTVVAALRVSEGKPFTYPLVGRIVRRF